MVSRSHYTQQVHLYSRCLLEYTASPALKRQSSPAACAKLWEPRGKCVSRLTCFRFSASFPPSPKQSTSASSVCSGQLNCESALPPTRYWLLLAINESYSKATGFLPCTSANFRRQSRSPHATAQPLIFDSTSPEKSSGNSMGHSSSA